MRLEELQREVGDVLVVEWRAFMLRPDPEPRSLESFTRYTQRWAQIAELEPAATFRTWSGDHDPPSHSRPPLAAGAAVRATAGPEAFSRFHLALMRAYFADNRTISDRAVILEVAASVGIDTEDLSRRLDEDADELEAEIVADHRAALALGIAAVPTALVNGEHILQGALTLDQYRRVVQRLGG